MWIDSVIESITVPSQVRKHALLGLLVCLGAGSPAWAASFDYHKQFVLRGVLPTAPIAVGGEVQTWQRKDETTGTHRIIPNRNTVVQYTHAELLIQNQPVLLEGTHGLPLSVVNGINVSTNSGKTDADGNILAYQGMAQIANDGHNALNSSSATVNIGQHTSTLDPFTYWNPLAQRGSGATVTDFHSSARVTVDLIGSGVAGAPIDEPENSKLHSADSVSAVKIKARQAFIFNGELERYELLVKNRGKTQVRRGPNDPVAGGGTVFSSDAEGKTLDPIFVEVIDLDTGVGFVETLATYEVDWLGADYVVDEEKIQLTIDPNSPTSFVDIAFAALSSWVVDPHEYQIRLDDNGLFVDGIIPDASNWIDTSTSALIQYTLFLGPEGLPYDRIDFDPDPSLFTLGHTYEISPGSAGGAYALEPLAVPEPTHALLLALSGLLTTRRLCARVPTP